MNRFSSTKPELSALIPVSCLTIETRSSVQDRKPALICRVPPRQQHCRLSRSQPAPLSCSSPVFNRCLAEGRLCTQDLVGPAPSLITEHPMGRPRRAWKYPLIFSKDMLLLSIHRVLMLWMPICCCRLTLPMWVIRVARTCLRWH